MKKTEMIVGATDGAPEVAACAIKSRLLRSEACPNPGFMAEISTLLFRFSKINWTLTTPFPVEEDHWQEGLRLVRNGTWDTIIGCFTANKKFETDYKMSLTVVADHWCAVTVDSGNLQKPPGLHNMFNFMHVFDAVTWLIVIGCLLQMHLYTVTTQQFTLTYGTSRHLGPIVVAGGLWSIFVISLYRNGIFRSLLIKDETFDFYDLDSLSDLVAAGQMKIICDNPCPWHVQLDTELHVRNSVIHKFRKALEKHPMMLYTDLVHFGTSVDTDQQLIDYMRANSAAFITERSYCAYYESTFCDVRIVPLTDLYERMCSMIFNLHFPHELLEKLNKQISHAYGFIEVIMDSYLRRLNGIGKRCVEATGKGGLVGYQAIDLETFSGLFLSLVVACVLGTMCLLGERIVRHYKQEDNKEEQN